MSDKIFEFDFGKKRDSFNALKVSSINSSGKDLRLSLSGGGMDFYLPSEYATHGGLDWKEETEILDGYEAEVQEIIDAYLVIIEAKLREIDAALLEAAKKKAQKR